MKTLEELQADPPDVCTCENLGLRIFPKDPDDQKAVASAAETIAAVDEYLSVFVGTECPQCELSLVGFFDGTFTWGIQSGHGYCAHCNWPCVAKHDIKDHLEIDFLPLAVHPKYVARHGIQEEREDSDGH